MSNTAPAATHLLTASALKTACSSCGLRELCLPVGFTDSEMARLDGLVAQRLSVKRGASLYEAGKPFDAL